MSVDEKRPLPEGWGWTNVNEITDSIRYGHTESANYEPVGPKFLRITDIQNGRVNWVAVPYCSCTEEEHGKYVLKDGDIVFARTGATTGKSFLISNPPDAVFVSYLIRLRVHSTVSPKYLSYYFQTPTYWSQILTVRKGSAQPGVNAKKLSELDVPLAPLAEQKVIVAEIEKQFTRLDQAVASLKRAQANLQRYKASVLKAACDGSLVPQDPTDESAEKLLQRILAERRRQWEEQEWAKLVQKAQKKVAQSRRKAQGLPARLSDLETAEWQDIPEDEYGRYLPKNDKWKEKYKEPAAPDTAELSPLPDSWTWANVDQLGEVRLGRQRSPKNHQGAHMRPYLRAANATWSGVDLSDVMEMNFEPEEFEVYRLQKGDILLAEASGSVNELGKPFIWNEELPAVAFQNTLIRVRLSQIRPNYLYYHFRSDATSGRFGSISKGVGIHHLGAQRLAKMAVAIPPVNEQGRIVDELERQLTVIAANEKAIVADLARAERLRQSILQQAFSGQLMPQENNLL